MLPTGPRRAAVLGSPIAHSLSPVLHSAAYAALGLDWRYDAVEIDEAGLPGFLQGLDRAWVGLSLTMPLKEVVLPLLDSTTDLARITRSANTVLLGRDGRLGDNTDVFGIVAALREAGLTTAAQACIIGAGATARSAMAAAAQLGAQHVTVVARRPEAAGGVLRVAAELAVDATAAPWGQAAAALVCPLVISTVPGDAAAGLSHLLPPKPDTLLDVTYAPWPTSLARAWADAGGTVVAGAQMLLWQAARQVELMTGRPAPVEAMRSALKAAPARD